MLIVFLINIDGVRIMKSVKALKYKNIIILSLLVIVGCDKVSGVDTYAELDSSLDLKCIDKVIRSINSAGKVEYSQDQSDAGLFLPNKYFIVPNLVKTTNYSYVWTYWEGNKAILQIHKEFQIKSKSESWSYSNGMGKYGKPYPASEIDKFIPVMNKVNEEVEKFCKVPLKLKGKFTRD